MNIWNGKKDWSDEQWQRYYDLEFAGACDNLMIIIQIAEMVEEGRHYMGVTLVDEESAL